MPSLRPAEVENLEATIDKCLDENVHPWYIIGVLVQYVIGNAPLSDMEKLSEVIDWGYRRQLKERDETRRLSRGLRT